MANIYSVPESYMFRIDKVIYMSKGWNDKQRLPSIIYHLEGSQTTYSMTFPNEQLRDQEYDRLKTAIENL